MKTHICTQLFYGSVEFVRDNPGEPVPEETFTHSHSSWSSIIPICFLHLLRSIASSVFNPRALQSFSTISLQVFFGLPLGLVPSTSYSIHFFTQSCMSCLKTITLVVVTQWSLCDAADGADRSPGELSEDDETRDYQEYSSNEDVSDVDALPGDDDRPTRSRKMRSSRPTFASRVSSRNSNSSSHTSFNTGYVPLLHV